MKTYLLLLLSLISFSAFAQVAPKYGGIALRVNDSTTYIASQASAHALGYADIFYNNQATTKHYDIWNGSSYDHVFDFNAGGSTPTLQQVLTAGSVLTGNNAITGPHGLSIETGTSAAGVHGLDVTAAQVRVYTDTLDLTNGSRGFLHDPDQALMLFDGQSIVADNTNGLTLTTDNASGVKVSAISLAATGANSIMTRANTGTYIASRQFKQSVKTSSTTNIADLSNAGASIDGITLGLLDRVLLKDQSTGSQNGIYLVSSTTPTVLTRVSDLNSSTYEGLYTNSLVLVDQGTANGGKAYRLSTTGNITIGTTPLTFTEFGAGGVSSVFSRTGAVTAQSGDYTVAQVTGAAPLASPVFTGAPSLLANINAGSLFLSENTSTGTSSFAGLSMKSGTLQSYIYQTPTTYTNAAFSNAIVIQSHASTNLILTISGGTPSLKITTTGIGIGGVTTPTAKIHLPAGTTTAGTAPQKYTSGPLMTTPEAAASEFDGSHYKTSTALNRVGIGGPIADFTSDAANSGTSETDLYTYTTKASTLSATGEKITANFTTISSDATADSQYKIYFGGTQIFDSGTLTTTTGTFKYEVLIIRTGASTARSIVSVIRNITAGSGGPQAIETDLTGLTFSGTNIIKITGQASGAGGGTGDLTAKMGVVNWYPAAAN